MRVDWMPAIDPTVPVVLGRLFRWRCRSPTGAVGSLSAGESVHTVAAKFSSRLGAAGDFALLNVGRRIHLPFEHRRVERLQPRNQQSAKSWHLTLRVRATVFFNVGTG